MSENKQSRLPALRDFQFMGIPLAMYAVICVILWVSMGFGCGGADYGKVQPKDFGGGSGAGVKIEPVAFLVIREGTTRVLPVAMPPMTTLDRVVEMMPDLVDKVEKYFDKKEEKEPV